MIMGILEMGNRIHNIIRKITAIDLNKMVVIVKADIIIEVVIIAINVLMVVMIMGVVKVLDPITIVKDLEEKAETVVRTITTINKDLTKIVSLLVLLSIAQLWRIQMRKSD